MFSITKKILLSIVVLCTIFLGLTAFTSYSVKEKITASEYSKAIQRMDMLVSEHLNKKLDIGITNAVGFSANPKLQDALRTGNREMAIAALSTISEMYKSNTNFKGIKVHLHDKDGVSLVRSWNIDKFGERLTEFRPLVTKVIQQKKAVVGFELGKVGLMIRAIAPIIDANNQYLGSVEFLQGVGSISRDMEKLGKTYILLANEQLAKKSPTILNSKKFGDYYSVNDKWFSDKVVNEISQINIDDLVGNKQLLTEKNLFTYIPATLNDGTVVGYHVIGTPRENVETAIDQSLEMATLLISLFCVAFLVTILVLLYFLRNVIIKPIKNIGHSIKVIAAGDFTQKITTATNDELGELAKAVNDMADRLSDSFAQVQANASKLDSLSIELNTSSQAISEGSREQSEAVSSSAVAVEQSVTTIAEIADNALSVSNASENARDSASKGREMTATTYAIMEQIGHTVRESSATVQTLGDSSQRIGEIIQVIEDIASQTNLLALNAAIEAARAGEHGRGFSVVADEVRKLAEKTVSATQEITTTVELIQKETDTAVANMENGVTQVTEGIAIAQKSSDSLEQIYSNVQAVSEDIAQIAVASSQQRSTVELFEKSITDIDSVSVKNQGITQETTSHIDTLNTLSDELGNIVRQFKIHH